MLKLQLTNGQGSSQHDTNIKPDRIHTIQGCEFVKRGEGVGGGFKGRAANRVTIGLGDRDWRNVILPDSYDFESIESVMILDSTGVMNTLLFQKSTDRIWLAQQPDLMDVPGASVPGYQGAPPRTFEVRRAFKNALDFIGEVGVNDLGFLLNCEVQLPQNHDTTKNRDKIYNLAEKLGKEIGTPVAAEIVLTGAGAVQKQVVGEGHLGAHPHADRAMAGRQQIMPVGYAPGAGPREVAAIQPFSGEGSGEASLQPGQNEQPYGSLGPKDQE